MTRSVKTALLEAAGVAVDAGRRRVVEGVSLALRPGQLVVVLGPNGAGKSTLLRALAGLVVPSQGAILLDGQPIGALSRRDVARRVAVVPQQIELPEDQTVREVVASGRAPHRNALFWPNPGDAAIVEEALASCDLLPLADRPLAHLSGGEQRRAIVARALAQTTPILLLDEPTAHLDLKHAHELLLLLRRLIDRRDLAALAVLHDLNLAARFADHVILLRAGAIAAQGSPSEVLQPATLEAVFEIPLVSFADGDTRAFAPR